MAVRIKEVINIRDKELKIPFLMYAPIVRRVWQAKWNMDMSDWYLLHWIYGWVELHGSFTKGDFNTAETMHSWNPKRIQSYMDKEWLSVTWQSDRMEKRRKRWTMTHKGKYMIGDEYNKLISKSLLSVSDRHNPLMKDKHKNPSINQMIEDKEFHQFGDEIKNKQ